MAKTNLNKKETANANATDKYKIVIAVLATALVASLVGLGAMYFKGNDTVDQQQAVEEFLGVAEPAQVTISKAEKERLYGVVGTALENARKVNYYASVQDGDDSYVSMVYNKDGGCFAHASNSGYISVFRGDDKAIRFTDYVEFGDDCDVLTQLEHVYELLGEGKAEAYGVAEADENEYFDQLVVDVKGIEGARALHSKTSTEYADIMITSLEEALLNASADETTGIAEGDDINFRFIYVVDKESNFLYSAACYLYFGDIKGSEVEWADLYGSWGYAGALEVYDWEMLEEWKTLDWENIANWESVEEAEKLLEEQYNIVNDMVGRFAEDNGLVDEEAADTTTSESTEEAVQGALGTVQENEDGTLTINLGGTTDNAN